MASPPAHDQRRPSASLRTRRPSTIYAEEAENEDAVPPMPTNNLAAYTMGGAQPGFPPNSAGPTSGRPSPRHAKSSDRDVRPGMQRTGTGNSGGHSGGPSPAPPDSSKVGAYLLNKRQSVSFARAMPPRGSQMDGPPVPSLPIAHQQQRQQQQQQQHQQQGLQHHPRPSGSVRRPAEASAGEEMISNGPRGPSGQALTDLLKEDFDAEAFLQSHLTAGGSRNATNQLEDMRKLKAALNHVLDGAQTSLQTNVIKNYHEFIKVSKDIATLETEMMELKGVLDEWKTVPESLEIEQSFDHNSSLGKNRRNSLADLQALYKTQLEALWESVEGAQRFLPAIPGRHILGRHPDWIELNSATYRPRQNVILVLLNDALLVTVEKRRQMGGTTRVVADRCFHLNEIAVTDLKDTGGLTNAVRVKRDREVSIFRTEKPEDKRMLLSAFKKILEETLSRRRKESVWEAEHRRDTMFGGHRPMPHGNHPSGAFQPSSVFSFVTSHDTTGKDLSWVDDVADQLAVHIAQREFEEAVALIETAKSVLPKIESDHFAQQLLRDKIETRGEELAGVLLAGLADPGIRKTGVVKNSGWLLRLGQGERARETFLNGRGELLKKRTGDIHFSAQGDSSVDRNNPSFVANLVAEIAQLSFVCFTVIRNTCEWYIAAYKDHQAASAFVRWASVQVEVFADIFKRQVYTGSELNEQVLQQCMDTVTAQAAMLKEVGLDFAFLLSSHLRPPAAQVAL